MKELKQMQITTQTGKLRHPTRRSTLSDLPYTIRFHIIISHLLMCTTSSALRSLVKR